MTIKSRILRLFYYSRYGISIRIAILLAVLSCLIGSIGYSLIEGISLFEGFYFHVITFSTVGYGEIPDLSHNGKVFTVFMILLNIAIFAYTVSAFTQYVTEGNIFSKLLDRRMQSSIDRLENHVIICGFGRYGKQCMDHFEHQKKPYVIIDRDFTALTAVIETHPRLKYIIGDSTEDPTLIKAGIERAHAIIMALPDDTENLFTVLTAKQLNPKLKIISRANDARSERKLQLAGATHVLMPEQIGGFYMATLLDKPGTIEFFSYLSREAEADVDFEEIEYHELRPEYQGKTILDLNIRKLSGSNVIGVRNNHSGRMYVNPDPSVRFERDVIFIVLGTKKQIQRLKEIFYTEEYHD